MSTRKPTNAPQIQSLYRANAILDVIAGYEVVGLAQLSRETGLNKTTVFNLVESLVQLRFVERALDPKGYRLGLRHLELGRAVQRRLNIVTLSRPYLLRLCALTRETVNLAVPYVFDALIVESMEGTHGIRATSYAGTRAPYHATACGKAMLAFQDAQLRAALYKMRPLIQMTPNTITDVEQLEQQLAEIHRNGYALDCEENEVSACCVAAPIFDGFNQLAGAVSLSGPTSRLSEVVLRELAKIVVTETKAITQLLSGGSVTTSTRPGRC